MSSQQNSICFVFVPQSQRLGVSRSISRQTSTRGPGPLRRKKSFFARLLHVIQFEGSSFDRMMAGMPLAGCAEPTLLSRAHTARPLAGDLSCATSSSETRVSRVLSGRGGRRSTIVDAFML